jgi:hypothetical protein
MIDGECPKSKRIDGKFHSWVFDGDDPYIICFYCGERRDAITGRIIDHGYNFKAVIFDEGGNNENSP